MPFALADNARLLIKPFLHLRERMPEVAMIQLLEVVVVLSHCDVIANEPLGMPRALDLFDPMCVSP